jgi:hypothetical protein
VDIDPVVLRELKRRQRQEKKTLGRLVSELLAAALRRDGSEMPTAIRWRSAPMGALVDIENAEALRRALDES